MSYGNVVTATPGTWDADVDYSYVWRRNGQVIAGASGSSYTLSLQDLGSRITVVVTGAKRGWVTKSVISTSSAKVSR